MRTKYVTHKIAGQIVYYQVRKNFGDGCKQMLVVNTFDLKSKSVALCLKAINILVAKISNQAPSARQLKVHPKQQKGGTKKRTTVMKIKDIILTLPTYISQPGE